MRFFDHNKRLVYFKAVHTCLPGMPMGLDGAISQDTLCGKKHPLLFYLRIPSQVVDVLYGLDELYSTMVRPQGYFQSGCVTILDHSHLQQKHVELGRSIIHHDLSL